MSREHELRRQYEKYTNSLGLGKLPDTDFAISILLLLVHVSSENVVHYISWLQRFQHLLSEKISRQPLHQDMAVASQGAGRLGLLQFRAPQGRGDVLEE